MSSTRISRWRSDRTIANYIRKLCRENGVSDKLANEWIATRCAPLTVRRRVNAILDIRRLDELTKQRSEK